MRCAALVLFASVLVLGACNDGDPDTAGSQGTTTSTTGSPEAPDSAVDSDVSNPGDERFCDLARSYVEQFTGQSPGDARGFGQALQEAQAIVLEMQEVAPAEIVGDVLSLADVLGVIVPALEAAEFDLSQVPPEALQRLQDPDFQASATRLQAYIESACEPVADVP